MCKKKFKNFIKLFFLKNFSGWILLCLIIFFVTSLFNFSIEHKLIIFGLILAFGSLVYSWNQMKDLLKSPDLNVFLSFEGKHLKEIVFKKNKMYRIEIVAENTGDKIADKFACLLSFEKIEELEYGKSESFYEYHEIRGNKIFIRLENSSKAINFIFPNFAHSFGYLDLKYSQKSISSHVIEYIILANNMDIKKGKLKISIE